MGAVHQPHPVLLILAAFSRYPSAIEWAVRRATLQWGRVALSSHPFEFNETDYYQASMGKGLFNQFFAFENFVDPARLVEFKHQTNAWESTYRQMEDFPESRPVNLDPGYLTGAKLVLASTKDHAHRIYLTQGIYAEVTLHFTQKKWRSREWTYPDYQRADYHEFFDRCRDYYRRHQALLTT